MVLRDSFPPAPRCLTSSCGVPLNHRLVISCDYQCVNTPSSNMAYIIHYQLHAKALLSLKRIVVNRTPLFLAPWPHEHTLSLLPISLSLPFNLSVFVFPSFCALRRDGFFVLISKIQISSEKIKASLGRR